MRVVVIVPSESGRTCLSRTDLNPGLSATQMIHRPQQGGRENLLQSSVAAVAQPQPEHLSWWALFIQKVDELKDRRVASFAQPVITHRHRLDSPPLPIDPARQQGRQLGIQPEPHPTNTGWSICRAA